MRLGYALLPMSLLASGVSASSDETSAAFYQLSTPSLARSPVLDTKEALIYLADKYDVSDYYNLGDNEELFDLLSNEREKQTNDQKSKLIAVINGVAHPNTLFSKNGINPTIKINSDEDSTKSLVNQVLHRFPTQYASLNRGVESNKLTEEIVLISSTSSSNEASVEHELITHFKFFNEKLLSIWKSFKTSTMERIGHQQVIQDRIQNPSTLDVINDKLFINDLSQLIHLKNVELNPENENVLFIKLNSLASLGKKAGFNSKTFEFSSQVLADFLVELSNVYELDVLVTSDHLSKEDLEQTRNSELFKRSKELEAIFERDLVKASSSGFCFSSEEACQASTSNCNSHGVCSKVKSKCWSCLCSPTFDKKKSKTTRWAGVDCGKKQISSEANLLLWTGVALLVLIAGGIKLLYEVGTESLPGVLDAATSVKKTT